MGPRAAGWRVRPRGGRHPLAAYAPGAHSPVYCSTARLFLWPLPLFFSAPRCPLQPVSGEEGVAPPGRPPNSGTPARGGEEGARKNRRGRRGMQAATCCRPSAAACTPRAGAPPWTHGGAAAVGREEEKLGTTNRGAPCQQQEKEKLGQGERTLPPAAPPARPPPPTSFQRLLTPSPAEPAGTR